MAGQFPDGEQFSEIFRETHHDVFRFSAWLTSGDASWAEEITAETYRRAWEKRERMDGREGEVTPWLLTIARNIYIDGYRMAGRTTGLIDGSATASNKGQRAVESDQIHREEGQELWALIAQLPPEHREMLVLRYVFDWRVKDIGELLGMKPNTVSVAIRRSLSTLEARWGTGMGSKEE